MTRLLYDHLWTDGYGTIDDQDTDDDFSYYMYSAYSDDYIYIYTEALGRAQARIQKPIQCT
uniref:hypothetical protein n=1 Tax=Flavobacterium myungsuense TaxID=651823 RepID=UPI0036D31A34